MGLVVVPDVPPQFSQIVVTMFTNALSHYLVGYYTTHQLDGVHIEARCTCGVKLEGVGQDESAAMSTLWKVFREHTRGMKTNGAG
jgi:hypothetical protein